jgi:hypothetical protein
MTNRKPFPILSALRTEGDTATLRSLRLWMTDYHECPPQVAANDNDPDVRPVEWETSRYELDAMSLIIAVAEDENNQRDNPKHVKRYSPATHGETQTPKIRRTKNPMPPEAEVDAEVELARHIDAQKMRAWLGSDAKVLDMAIGPHTYREVGHHIGASGSDDTLERAGKQEVKDVAKVFWDVAA